SPSPRGRPAPKARRRSRALVLEPLEDRTLPSISLTGVPNWVEQGPGPITGGQDEGIGGGLQHPLGPNPVARGGNAHAADPGNADRVFVGTVNGGVWRTTNATSASPPWQPLTDTFPSLSIETLALSPVNANTLFAGIGRTSNQSRNGLGDGGPLTGLLRSTDG